MVVLETGVSLTRNLNDYPFTYDDGALRFGIERFSEAISYVINIYDDTNGKLMITVKYSK